jgi:hypothetical protein
LFNLGAGRAAALTAMMQTEPPVSITNECEKPGRRQQPSRKVAALPAARQDGDGRLAEEPQRAYRAWLEL